MREMYRKREGEGMNTSYDTDVVAWANEQAALIRAGHFDQLDLSHIAEEIEDVGKSEQRELASRMAVLLMHLLKWQYQPNKRTNSWTATIKTQRKAVAIHLRQVPSLKPKLNEAEWVDLVWGDARLAASKETAIDFDIFPETFPWAMTDVLTEVWLP